MSSYPFFLQIGPNRKVFYAKPISLLSIFNGNVNNLVIFHKLSITKYKTGVCISEYEFLHHNTPLMTMKILTLHLHIAIDVENVTLQNYELTYFLT